jgi:hypothetical protein
MIVLHQSLMSQHLSLMFFCGWRKFTLQRIEESDRWMLILTTIDNYFNEKSKFLFLTGKSFEPKEFKSLRSICERYSENLKNWLHNEEENSSMNSILRSNELLLYWMSTCLLFHSLKFENTFVQNCSIPLDWKNLSFLVLDSKKSTESLLIISNYLQSTSQIIHYFHLRVKKGL